MDVTTEQVVTMPITNPATGRASTRHTFAGKLDLIEGHVISDWKTCTNTKDYAHERLMSYQAELYVLASKQPITEVQYRLIARPKLKLCSSDLPKGSPKGSTNFDVKHYEARVYAWMLERPERMVELRHPLNHARLGQAEEWLWNIHVRLMHCEKHGFLTNSHGCKAWHKDCPYMPLCAANALGGDVRDVIKRDYEKRPVAHAELGIDDPDVITFSSASCLCLCERKYDLLYRQGLKPRNQDDGEALFVGSATHKGLEHYKKHFSVDAALAAIDQWEKENPILGGFENHADKQHAQDERIAKARGMTRAAAVMWPNPDTPDAGIPAPVEPEPELQGATNQ